jgi:hypothetical protein
MDNFDLKKFLIENKLTKLSEETEDNEWEFTAGLEWGKREPEDAIEFYNSIKPGQKVRYAGKDKNGFKHGEYYEVDQVKLSPSSQKIVVLKNGGRKLIVKGTRSIQ